MSDVLHKCWPSYLDQHKHPPLSVVHQLNSRQGHNIFEHPRPHKIKTNTHTHTHTPGRTPLNRWSALVAEAATYTTQHTTHKTEKHRCPQGDSNRRSHQSSGFRTSSSTAWAPGLASRGQSSNLILFCSFYCMPLMWACINREHVR